MLDLLKILEPEQEVAIDLIDAKKVVLCRIGLDYRVALMPMTREGGV